MPVNKLSIEGNKPSGNGNPAATERIIVIGASAGGFEAFKKIIQNLPADINASIFIVWHMSPDVRGILPQVLNRLNTIVASQAYNNEEIKPNHIYVAPPDHHMLIEEGRVLITHGPKENRFRPAVDPLFRSAAYAYGNRVIGVILSGALDDGTAGLWTVKHYGGIAIVQDPNDAEVPSMPENAMREVKVDYCVGVSELPDLLVRLSKEPLTEHVDVMKDEQTKKEIQIAAEESALGKGVLNFGDLSPYTCPECHGVLSRLRNDNIVRYRCHTGHAYSADTLMASITEKIEDGLYSAIRGMDESIMLLNQLGDHYAEANQPRLAALYFKKAKEAQERSEPVRKAALDHQQFSKDGLRNEIEDDALTSLREKGVATKQSA
jgi:two-component system, chemotaxis family, protein-glutamate methylesterase/glutaminase